MKRKNNNGFTLVELLVTLGLVGIIISLVMSFFIANIKSYNNITDDTELQYQSQYILNYMTNKILESKKIKVSTPTAGGIINKISFQYGTENECHNFEVKNKKILYCSGPSSDIPDIELGSNVESIEINSIPSGTSMTATKSIEIILKLKNNNRQYEAKQVVYMRNN